MDNIDKTAAEGAATIAEGEAVKKNDKGTYSHKFKTPYEFEGKKYEVLNFYFGGLTGKDMIAVETEMTANGEYALAPEISTGFLCRIAARAAKVGSDVIENLPIGEFSKIRNAARDFLLNSGLQDKA
jgi:hypothetical protein